MLDAIVFTKSELKAAIGNGASRILLCGEAFKLPHINGASYTNVGMATALADFSNTAPACLSDIRPCSYSSSYRYGSYSTSYRYGSYATSYKYGSYSASYAASYTASYRHTYRTSFFGSYRLFGSHFGSYATSYRLSTSYKTSFFGSFTLTSFIRGLRNRLYKRVLKEISVNGYGIHLI